MPVTKELREKVRNRINKEKKDLIINIANIGYCELKDRADRYNASHL